jgi:hypothetical protein
MIELFSLSMILVYSAFFGITMKIADLLDEHGLRLFKGDAILFGFIWGFFGALLVLSRVDIANITLAMILAFLIRMRLDYRNHVIASTIIIITFIWKSIFDMQLFFIFFFIFVIFGGLRDYLGDVRKKKDWLYKINEPAWYYVIPNVIYGMITNNWIIFLVFTIYITFYDLTKYFLFYTGKYSNL